MIRRTKGSKIERLKIRRKPLDLPDTLYQKYLNQNTLNSSPKKDPSTNLEIVETNDYAELDGPVHDDPLSVEHRLQDILMCVAPLSCDDTLQLENEAVTKCTESVDKENALSELINDCLPLPKKSINIGNNVLNKSQDRSNLLELKTSKCTSELTRKDPCVESEIKDESVELTKTNVFLELKNRGVTLEIKNKVNNKKLKEKTFTVPLLSVTVDNTYSLQNKCLTVNKMIDEFFGKQDNIYQKIESLKQIIMDLSPIKSQSIDAANVQTKKIIELIQKQKPRLTHLQQKISEIVFSSSLFTYPNIKDDNINSLSVSLKSNQKEFQTHQKKNQHLEKQVKNLKGCLRSVTLSNRDRIFHKDRYILSLHKKLRILKNQMKVITEKKAVKICTESDQKLQNLMTNIIEYINEIQSRNNIHRDDLVSRLEYENEERKLQIERKNELIRRKNKKIRRLILEEQRAKNKLKMVQREQERKSQYKDVQIQHYKSALDNLQKKQNRWMVDRFYVQNHATMLYQRLRQLESKIVDQKNKHPKVCK